MKHALSVENCIGPAALAFLALGLAACFNPSYDQPRCGPEQACPSGLTCVAEVCVRDPGIGAGDPDAGTDGPRADAPMIDAPPAVTTFPSCIDLPRTCGPNGNGDCCESPTVPGGTYFRAYDASGGGTMNFPATVSDFRLDKYEVTVGRFRRFLELSGRATQVNPPVTGSGAHARIPDSGWRETWNSRLPATLANWRTVMQCTPLATWNNSPGTLENRPINCVSFYVAMAFCIWDGGYLPTEAEWNYAAAGGNQHRIYPWSDPPTAADVGIPRASYDCLGDTITGCSLNDLVPVGSKPAGNGRWGHADLAGNVHEWMLDSDGNLPVPCVDCAHFRDTAGRVSRGGQYNNSIDFARLFSRTYSLDTQNSDPYGFRCARPVR